MKNERLLLAAVAALLGLLIVLGWLQYSWLGEISRSERENLQNRLNADSRRLAVDFDNEIRWAYFTFRFNFDDWQKKDWSEFSQKRDLWISRAAYPELIEDFYFVEMDSEPLKFNQQTFKFQPVEWNEELTQIKNKLQESKNGSEEKSLVVNKYVLLSPVYTSIKQERAGENGIPNIRLEISGYAAIKLRSEVVRKMLADLQQKYFPDDRFASYDLVISDNATHDVIFANRNGESAFPAESDVKVPLFYIASNQFRMLINNRALKPSKTVERYSINSPLNLAPLETNKKVQILGARNRDTETTATGEWTLSLTHRDGSLEQFIGKTRRKNLLVSFGILTLLGASVVLIFVAVRRSQALAQRQLHFVSAVSHEFRTPVAVIHSAGENLSDGIVGSAERVERYGNLIKGEAKKLSWMVEQILEFAGARSGKRKYVFRETNIEEIIDGALNECRSLLTEKGFSVETEIQPNLPTVQADKSAMICAMQNLIINSVKYAGDAKWLKVSVKNGGGQIKIAVADRGIGVSKKDAAKIFSPFYRAKEVVDAQIHGSGLGLSVVRQTIEAHRGKIRLTSEPGKGSEFTIFLPQKES